MPTKTHEYYLTTSSSRDFTWFFFKPPATVRPPKSKAEPEPPYRVSKARRTKMPSTTEALRQPRKTRADVKARNKARDQTVKAKPESTKPKKSDPKRAESNDIGPWSDWYVGEDRNYFWRARQSQDEIWDYEFTPGYQDSPMGEAEDTVPATSNSEIARPRSPSPNNGQPSPVLSPSLDPTSPKSSWPTIITTSTGQPTKDLSASSSRTLFTLPEEVDDSYQLYTTDAAFITPAATSKAPLPRSNKRPVGPVMRLLQESRNRRNRVKTELTKSTTANTTGAGQYNTNAGPGGRTGGGTFLTRNRTTTTTATTSAFTKKLHAKVKAEKELRMDPKKRVKTWLRGVEVDWALIPLDGDGFPVYR